MTTSKPTYASAAIVAGAINANGTIQNSKNIASVTLASSGKTGVYCVKTKLRNVSGTMPQVTASGVGNVATVVTGANDSCSGTGTYTVSIWNTRSGQRTAAAFFISVT